MAEDGIIADTIRITEPYFEDIPSEGADVYCTVLVKGLTLSRKPTPEILNQEFAAAGLSDGCLSIREFQHESEWGCALVAGIVLNILAYLLVQWSLPIIAVKYGWMFFLCLIVLVLFLGKVFRNSSRHISVFCRNGKEVSIVQGTLGRFGSNVSGVHTKWRQPLKPEMLETWAETCIKRARVRAEKIATELGVRIIGIHSYIEEHSLPPDTYSSPPSMGGRVRMTSQLRSAEPMSWDVDSSSRVRMGICVHVTYRVVNADGLNGVA